MKAIKQRVYGCYLSLADTNSTAYPPRSERFAETLIYLGNSEVHQDAIRKYMAIVLSVFAEYLSATEAPTPQSWYTWSACIPSRNQSRNLEGSVNDNSLDLLQIVDDTPPSQKCCKALKQHGQER